MIPRQRALAALGFGDRQVGALGQGCERRLSPAVQNAASADQQGGSCGLQQADQFVHFTRVGRLCPNGPYMPAEKSLREIERFRLHVLTEGQGHRPTGDWIEQCCHGAGQGIENLFGPNDSVEIAGHRPEAIVGGDRAVRKAFNLLQHWIGRAACKNISGQKQHGKTVHVSESRRGDHVGGTGPDGTRADHGAATPHLLCECDGGMGHALFTVRSIGGKRVPLGVKGFAKTRDVAVAEDRPRSCEITSLAGRLRHILVRKIANRGLRCSSPYRVHAAASARACRHALTSSASLSDMPFTAASSLILPLNHSRATSLKMVRPTANPLTTLHGAAVAK